MTIPLVTLFYFAALVGAIWAAAWVASKGKEGWGWILFIIVLVFGSMKIRESDIATCPKCNHTFESSVEKSNSATVTEINK